jgi:hypothetical protein
MTAERKQSVLLALVTQNVPETTNITGGHAKNAKSLVLEVLVSGHALVQLAQSPGFMHRTMKINK